MFTTCCGQPSTSHSFFRAGACSKNGGPIFLGMATRVAKLCTTPGCPRAGTYRGKCNECSSNSEGERNVRRSTSRRVYLSPTWRRLRLLVLSEEPYCQWKEDAWPCPAPATDVDHIVAIEDEGDRWARSNLQGLCHRHHSVKTARENGFGGVG